MKLDQQRWKHTSCCKITLSDNVQLDTLAAADHHHPYQIASAFCYVASSGLYVCKEGTQGLNPDWLLVTVFVLGDLPPCLYFDHLTYLCVLNASSPFVISSSRQFLQTTLL